MNDLRNIFNKKSVIDTLPELMLLFDKYKSLIASYDECTDKFDRIGIQEEINSIESDLRYGIEIDDELLAQFKLEISDFCDAIGLSIEQRDGLCDEIRDTKLTVSFVEYLSKGLLCNYGNIISVDYKYALFDEFGKFSGFSTNANFLDHAFIHELLHQISIKDKMIMYMDSFSEGMTDYFAHKISKASDVSGNYKYCERVFYMLGMMMGDDVLFDDYSNNLSTMPNLHNFLMSVGITADEYSEFYEKMNVMLEKRVNKKLDGIEELEAETNKFLYERIAIPYFNGNEERAREMINRVFSDSVEVKSDICEIHSSGELLKRGTQK